MSLADIQSMKAVKLAKQNASQLSGLGYTPAVVSMPYDFVPVLPFSFYRDIDNKVKHNMNFSRYKTTNATAMYVDGVRGSDGSGNGTKTNAYASLAHAFQVITANPGVNYTVYVNSYRFNSGKVPGNVTLNNQTVAIVPQNVVGTCLLTNHVSGLAWTLNGTGTWQASTTSIFSAVWDLRRKDSNGNPIPFTGQSSLANVQANANSWYSDGSHIYIHTNDGLAPDDFNYIIGNDSYIFTSTLLNGSKLYVENCSFVGASYHAADFIRVNGDNSGVTLTGECCFNNCIFYGNIQTYGYSQGYNNQFSVNNVQYTYMFNCIGAYGDRDGFNYHYPTVAQTTKARTCLVTEYNCKSYNQGSPNDTSNTNNSTTAHDGISIIRANCLGNTSNGPCCADANGCYTIMLDCTYKNPLAGANASQISAYYFDNLSVTAGNNGKAVLINCDGTNDSGNTGYSLNVDSGFSLQLHNFTGNNIATGLTTTYI